MTAVYPIDHATIRLGSGSHRGDDGPPPGDPDCVLCFFEWYNVLTQPPNGGPHVSDDRPAGVSPVLWGFGMRLNDALPDEDRQVLKAFLPQPDQPSPLAGTADDGHDDRRRWMAADWAVRWAAPRWLEAAGQTERADTLRALPPIVDLATYRAPTYR